ncbi:MAG: hypothetical protein E7262_02585 [Lachnospiraceae bacterium]|nr:hypothetical protein [Lachnospiraceae bacterium]
MKIKDKTRSLNIAFEDLDIEEVFKYNDRVFMKISEEEKDNSYDFSKHRITSFTEDTVIEYVQSELILHHREWEE